MALRKRNLNIIQGGDGIGGEKLDAKRKNDIAKIPNGNAEHSIQVDDDDVPMEVDLIDSTNIEYDFDKETADDFLSFFPFADDVFKYFKHREKFFKVNDYFPRQLEVNNEVRIRIVDWMVELQETFELTHETLYLSVKLVDLYLDRVSGVRRNQLQLIASAAVFVSSKYEEYSPPIIDDFIYLDDDKFTREEFLRMEAKFLLAVKFDLGAPLSYSFLRRYSRVLKLEMATLTLARYILETSLMFLDFCRVSESMIAVSSLLLALRMKKIGDWTPILEKYSGYKQKDVEPLVAALNHMLNKCRQEVTFVNTIFNKYSNVAFFHVARIPLLTDELPQASAIAPPEHLLLPAV